MAKPTSVQSASERARARRKGWGQLRRADRRDIRGMSIPRLTDIARAEPNLIRGAGMATMRMFQEAVGLMNRERVVRGERPIDMPGRIQHSHRRVAGPTSFPASQMPPASDRARQRANPTSAVFRPKVRLDGSRVQVRGKGKQSIAKPSKWEIGMRTQQHTPPAPMAQRHTPPAPMAQRHTPPTPAVRKARPTRATMR